MNIHEFERHHEGTSDSPRLASTEVMLHPDEETSVLIPRQQEILQLTAEGLLVAEIGEELNTAPATVKYHLRKIHQKMDGRPTLGIIIEGLDTGLVDPERVLSDRDPKTVDNLSPGQRKIMETLIATPPDRHDLREWTAERLGLSPNTVKNQLTDIAGKLKTRGIVHAGAVFAAAHKVRSQK